MGYTFCCRSCVSWPEVFMGCRYSVFVGCSLLLTFITLSASLVRALHLVHRLAACSDEESKCLYDVQRFVYKRLVKSYVRVDSETLELQATGVCRTLNSGNFGSIDIFDDRWQSSIITGEV